MPQVSRFLRLPPHVRMEIEERIIANGFGRYSELAAELRARGYRISRTSLHRFGKSLKERLQVLRDRQLAGVHEPGDTRG
jgi:hypothetical protein